MLEVRYRVLRHHDSYWLNEVLRYNLVNELIDAEQIRFLFPPVWFPRSTRNTTNASNDYMLKYHNMNTKEQCRVLTVMNGVFSTDDVTKNQEWYQISNMQINEIHDMMFTLGSIDFEYVARNTSLTTVPHNAYINCNTTSKNSKWKERTIPASIVDWLWHVIIAPLYAFKQTT
ncbi:hypothetical protein BD770DRAFT_406162 [Pilaira anomala]|nr:hypothetical protein BD770DRAFT_406162 [Pilaira anomala]